MYDFSPDEERRWNAWERANALSARRSDLIWLAVAVIMVAATLGALVVALWRR